MNARKARHCRGIVTKAYNHGAFKGRTFKNAFREVKSDWVHRNDPPSERMKKSDFGRGELRGRSSNS